ncbi:DUF3301 domain-containing protein [Alkalimonas delamerensis]|uniref:DUF3301 domain-containing protein n=1 Tax=Alkalimonas delamerensis TaxID=265981 RepID=A0ABT9GM14_9GAMM|nr:DUF3301 domain-containing protein [Alkalimonas delamerensis]MDP4528015.1 DUF3301 domain-containing protein [Alkalimonas delamerensis]
MGTTWLIIGLLVICYLFWLQRKQDERAILLARHLCKQRDLQYLDCARLGHKLEQRQGRLRWLTYYCIDFSSDRESRYQATLSLNGLQYTAFEVPPHRLPEPPAN